MGKRERAMEGKLYDTIIIGVGPAGAAAAVYAARKKLKPLLAYLPASSKGGGGFRGPFSKKQGGKKR